MAWREIPEGSMEESALAMLQGRKNERAFSQLCDVLRGGEALGLVGAGISARVGYGNWQELVGQLHQAVHRRRKGQQGIGSRSDERSDLLWIAESYRKDIEPPEKYHDLLTAYFAPRRAAAKDPCIRALALLPLRHILTTNYDNSIEVAAKRLGKAHVRRVVDWTCEDDVRDLMQSFPTNDGRFLVYLHGRHDRPESIVLTERDYVKRYVSSDATERRLFAIFSMRRVVFFGFSLEDPDLMAIFRQTNAVHGEPRHFALLGLPKDGIEENARARFEAKFGVTPIFYEVDRVGAADPHHRLVSLMNELAAVSTGARKRTSPGRRVRVAGATRVRRRRPPVTQDWRETLEFKNGRAKEDPEDPQKGRFGGRTESNGRKIEARVTCSKDFDDWYELELVVRRTGGQPLTGAVTFYVHDTFTSESYNVSVARGRARLRLGCWGAFTVGAIADGGRTALELDLSKLKGAPKEFREA